MGKRKHKALNEKNNNLLKKKAREGETKRARYQTSLHNQTAYTVSFHKARSVMNNPHPIQDEVYIMLEHFLSCAVITHCGRTWLGHNTLCHRALKQLTR